MTHRSFSVIFPPFPPPLLVSFLSSEKTSGYVTQTAAELLGIKESSWISLPSSWSLSFPVFMFENSRVSEYFKYKEFRKVELLNLLNSGHGSSSELLWGSVVPDEDIWSPSLKIAGLLSPERQSNDNVKVLKLLSYLLTFFEMVPNPQDCHLVATVILTT